ncbi:hypothetical protein ACLOJK_029584, partial [Asimina triloba]
DTEAQNWWVTFGYNEKPLGYFPKSLFNKLAEGADTVFWGGEIYTAGLAEEPQMGSGHFSNEGFGKAAFLKMVMTVDDQHGLKDAPTHKDPYCRRFFFFGGPGCN